MTVTKGTAIKLAIIAFLVFVVFKPEKSKEMYEQVKSQLNQVQVSSNENIESRVKASSEKANSVLDKYEGELKSPPTPTPDPEPECKCNGTGYIVHGDGHKTPCVCQNGQIKAAEQQKEDMEVFIEKAVQKSFDKYVQDYKNRAAAAAQAAQAVQPQQQIIQPAGQSPQ